MNKIRVILVDDHALFRRGMRGLLEEYAQASVVAEAADGDEFLEMIANTDIDLVFMDISMPNMSGDVATQRALEIKPDLKIITLSMFCDEHYYSRMVQSGAKGFLLKDSSLDEVLEAVETVCSGGEYFSQELLDSIQSSMQASSSGEVSDRASDILSTREMEILVGVCRGLSNQEIADELFISKRTVDKHRANIMEKTGCRNTANLVVYVIRNNIVEF
ncbi:MAG: response regulator transcription factor [Rikenellaceae bacterium]